VVTGQGGTASPLSRRGNKFDSPQTSFSSSSSSSLSLIQPLTQAGNGKSGPILTATSATPLQEPPAAPPGGSSIGADRANPAAGGRIGGGGYLSTYSDAADPEPTPAAGLYGDAADPEPLPVYKSGRQTTGANAAVLRTSSAVGVTGSTAGGVAGAAKGPAGAEAPRTAAAIGGWFGDAADPEPTSYYPSTRGTLQTRSDLCIPRNEAARPCAQFPHLCICEEFINSLDRSSEYINRSQIHECRGNGAVQYYFWEYLFPVFGTVSLH
jgi:hypothetical protein